MYFLIEFIEKIDELPYNEILAAICGVYVGLIALMYPKVYDLERDIFKESKYLSQDFYKNKIIKYGYCALCFLLIIGILSFLSKNLFILSLNLIFLILSLIFTGVFYKKISRDYTVNVRGKIIRLKIDKFNKNKILLLQDLSLNTFISERNSLYIHDYKLYKISVKKIL